MANDANSKEVVISEEQLKKAEHYIEEEEGAANRLAGPIGVFITAVAVIMSLFHLYAAYEIVPTQTLRPVHVGFMLFLSFLLFPAATRWRNRIRWWDWVAALIGVAAIAYMLHGGDDFSDRATTPKRWDKIFGVALIVLVLEATRRTSGWIMPAVVVGFIAYAMLGRTCRRRGHTAATTSIAWWAICT